MSRSRSLAAHIIGGTTPGIAHQEFPLSHDLGFTPGDALVIDRREHGRLYRGPTAWNATTIYLRSSIPNMHFQLLLFGGTAAPGSSFVATVVRRVAFDPVFMTVADLPPWPDGSTNYMRGFFVVPRDYDSGALEFVLFRRGAATNTAVMRRDSYRFRAATAVTTIESGTNIDFTPGNTNTQSLTFTIAAANFAVADIIRIDLYRLGAGAGDTMAAVVDFDGCWVDYTATL